MPRFTFLVDTYETEIQKVVSVWAACRDGDLRVRPHPTDRRGRCLLEHMVHQCQSEDLWFTRMLGITVTGDPVPKKEERLEFIRAYAESALQRLHVLRGKEDDWWEEEVAFFEVRRPRTWIMTRRVAHSAHHRGQQTALLRMLGRDVYSTYGPTADTGGLMRDHAPAVYPYPTLDRLLVDEAGAGGKAPLPGAQGRAVTERPED